MVQRRDPGGDQSGLRVDGFEINLFSAVEHFGRVHCASPGIPHPSFGARLMDDQRESAHRRTTQSSSPTKSASNVIRLWPKERAVARTIPSTIPKPEKPFFRFANLIAAASRQISLVRGATLAICSRASTLSAAGAPDLVAQSASSASWM